jgi:hypothetical protein
LTPLFWFFEALTFAAFVVEAWALIDVVGLGSIVYGVSLVSILPIVAFVAAAIYLTDVRPKVKEFRGGGSSSGPYGPW